MCAQIGVEHAVSAGVSTTASFSVSHRRIRSVRDGLSLLVRMPDWSDVDDCVRAVLDVCAGREIAGIMAPHAVTREAESRLRKALD
jgi:hypothetical protein